MVVGTRCGHSSPMIKCPATDETGMTYRAGIIGAGGVAGLGIYSGSKDDIGSEPVETSHAGGYAATDGIELVAIADRDPDRLSTFGRAWDIPAPSRYNSHAAMLTDADLDVVSVCTPTMFHAEHVLDAAQHVDAIWCEKPLACSVRDGTRMVDACAEANVDLVVNHSRRFMSQNQAVRELIADGLLGDVHTASVAASGELFRVTTHVIDLATFLLDDRAATIAGHITGTSVAPADLAGRDLDDAGGGGFVVTQDGVFLTIDGVAPREDALWYCRIVGTDGHVVLDDRGWTFWEHGADGAVETPLSIKQTETYADTFSTVTDHLIGLLEGAAEPISPGDESLASLEVLVGLYLSHYTDGRVCVPFNDPLADVTISSW